MLPTWPRSSVPSGMRECGDLACKLRQPCPQEWVVNCKHVGRGDKVLLYLGRYLYRGVLPEKNILSDADGKVNVPNDGQPGTRDNPDCARG